MTGPDAEIARNIRREFAKRPIDTTRVDIQVTGGRVTLAGTVSNLRDKPDVSLEAEMEVIEKLVTRDRIVKALYNQVRYQRLARVEHETNETRGRFRR